MPTTDTAGTHFDAYRQRAQAAMFGPMPAHIDRLGWDAVHIASFQRDRLRALLAVAMEASPYHARRLDGLDPSTFELEQLPALPVRPPAGRRIVAMVAAASPIHATGAATCVLQGSPAPFMPVPVTQPLADIVGALNDLQPDVLFGYPSMLTLLAHEQRAGRLDITPIGVTSNSKTLRPHQRERIRDAFRVPVVNVYGASEGLAGSSGPDELPLTFASDCCITELVDDENRPVPVGATASAVLLTNLFNHTQPLIRYRAEDRFIRQPNPANGHLRAVVDGRSSDLIDVGGLTVHPLTVVSPLTARAEIVDFHLRPTGVGVHVEVVAPEGTDGEPLRADIIRSMAAAGVLDAVVTLDVVDSLQRVPHSGKVVARTS